MTNRGSNGAVETAPGVRYVVEGDGLRLDVDLDQAESQIREWQEQGHKVGGYLLGIPAARVSTAHLEREIGAYSIDRALSLHTGARMYTDGNPLMAKWYLEQIREHGLFLETEEQLNASCNVKGECPDHLEQSGVQELQKTKSIKIVDGWCFPGEGALEHMALDGDLAIAREIQIQVKRGEKVVQEYDSVLSR